MTIYVASKTKHAARWKALRARGVPIVSTWIDEAGPNGSADLPDLWRRCVAEPATAGCVLVYAERGERLKGALVEVGVALGAGKIVYVVWSPAHGWAELEEAVGSWIHHPNVDVYDSVGEVLDRLGFGYDGGDYAA